MNKDFLESQSTSVKNETKSVWSARNIVIGIVFGTVLTLLVWFCFTPTSALLNTVKEPLKTTPTPTPTLPIEKDKDIIIEEDEKPYIKPDAFEILTPKAAKNGKILFFDERILSRGFSDNEIKREYSLFTVDPDGSNLVKLPYIKANSFSNDGKKILFTKSHADGKVSINTINIDGTDETIIIHDPKPMNRYSRPSFSPNDKEIIYIDHNKYVNIVNIQSQKISSFKSECTRSPTFTPDGQYILCRDTLYDPSGITGTIYVYSVETGKLVRELRSSSNMNSFSISPDGKRVAYVDSFNSGGFQISTINLNGDEDSIKVLFQSKRGIDALKWSPDGKCILFIRPAETDFITGDDFRYKRFLSKINLDISVKDGEQYKNEDIIIEDSDGKINNIESEYLSWQPIPCDQI